MQCMGFSFAGWPNSAYRREAVGGHRLSRAGRRSTTSTVAAFARRASKDTGAADPGSATCDQDHLFLSVSRSMARPLFSPALSTSDVALPPATPPPAGADGKACCARFSRDHRTEALPTRWSGARTAKLAGAQATRPPSVQTERKSRTRAPPSAAARDWRVTEIAMRPTATDDLGPLSALVLRSNARLRVRRGLLEPCSAAPSPTGWSPSRCT